MLVPKGLANSMDVQLKLFDDGRIKRLFDINDHQKERDTTGFQTKKQRTKKIMDQNKIENELCTVESLQENKWTTSKDKFNLYLTNSPNTELSKMWDQDLISKDQDYYPFWDSSCQDVYNKLWLPAKTDCVDLPLNSLTTLPKSLIQKSWYSTEAQTSLQMKSLPKIYSPSCKFSVVDGMENEATLKRKKPTTSKKTAAKELHNNIKARKIQFHPTASQKQTLKQLAGNYRKIYNDTLAYITNKNNPKISKFQLRDQFALENSQYISDHQYLTTLHSYSRAAAVFEARKNLITNATYKKKFKMQFKTRKSNSWCIPIRPTTYSITKLNQEAIGFTIMPRVHKDLGYFKVIKDRDRLLDKPIYEPRIIKDNTNKYYIILLDGQTVENQNVQEIQLDRIASIDPGIRTRHSIYFSNGNTLQIGCVEKDLLKLMRLRKRAEKLRALIKSKYIKTNPKQRKSAKRYKLKIAANKTTAKINQFRKEMDYKTIQTLFDQVDIVVLPKFEVQNMVSGRKLRKRERVRMQVWGHYKFRMRIIEKAKELGKKVLVVSEHYTSKTCGCCGWRDNNLGSKKIFTCKQCGLVIDRDVNGARNILLRAIRVLRNLGGGLTQQECVDI